MKSISELIEQIEGLGYSLADIASEVGKTVRSVENWKSGSNTTNDVRNKLIAMSSWPAKSQPTKVESDELTLLRIQNIILNLEAKQDQQSALLQEILVAVSGKSMEEVQEIAARKLTESGSVVLRNPNIVHKNK